MAYLTKQIYNIVNDAVKDAVGKNANLTNLDTSDLVSLGKAVSGYEAYEGFYKSLVNRIVRTVYFVRTYEGTERSILRDEHEYGAFVQKVYYELPEASENPTWNIPNNNNQYVQSSPYDVQAVVPVSSMVYGGKGTWTIEIVRPTRQVETAFTSPSEMEAFIDGIYLAVENAFKLEEERVISLAVNTAMAIALTNGKARNLLSEFNTETNSSLTVTQALKSADFLKYASEEINLAIKNMRKMSTVFNVDGYTTFTPTDKLVVEMLAKFASASSMYLEADTFHNELVKLPNYEEIPYWQGSGASFAFSNCSSINVKHDFLVDETDNPNGTVSQSGIICFLHDMEHVAAYFGSRRTWEVWNPRSEVAVHGEKADKGFAVDTHANGIVFYMA